ncbi:hypothetical protein FHG87_007684 [Trinorchestia longiramus]|nr:hypothetical protein FHG87_007684 [Trinorchestia longiramus]
MFLVASSCRELAHIVRSAIEDFRRLPATTRSVLVPLDVPRAEEQYGSLSSVLKCPCPVKLSSGCGVCKQRKNSTFLLTWNYMDKFEASNKYDVEE